MILRMSTVGRRALPNAIVVPELWQCLATFVAEQCRLLVPWHTLRNGEVEHGALWIQRNSVVRMLRFLHILLLLVSMSLMQNRQISRSSMQSGKPRNCDCGPDSPASTMPPVSPCTKKEKERKCTMFHVKKTRSG